ncbi:MAG: RHS repeat protein, partial [Lachnospiraceae bacterium]|nr:RHS repeat protein [Lachnospiraceae bacterium]
MVQMMKSFIYNIELNTECKYYVFISHIIAMNAAGTEVIKNSTRISKNGGSYQVFTVSESVYDKAGNIIQETTYPMYVTSGTNESIRYEYTYNALGQQTETTKTVQSKQYPKQNGTIVMDETTYDSFGNELSSVDEKGMKMTYRYDEQTGEESGSVTAVGTEQESGNNTYTSDDFLKTMTLDSYDRCTVEINDALGNTLIEKDEKAGTWTESEYEYREGEAKEEEDSEESDSETQGLLVEERTYSFTPTGEKVTVKNSGEKEYHYDIVGKGKEVLSGSRYVYDEDGEQIGSAEFSGGAMDAAHCSAWTFTKSETEVEDDKTIQINYSKKLNPSAYQEEVNKENYYNQFDAHVLKEEITETVTDEEGNQISEHSATISENDRQEEETAYEYDDFGQKISEETVTKRCVDGKWLPEKTSRREYTYDDLGNVTKTIQKEKKAGDSEWESQTTKDEYNELGQKVASYDPKGLEEGYATRYEYDLEGKLIKTSTPVEKKGEEVLYQTVENEYDSAGNLVKTREQQTGDTYAETEYEYDITGNLSLVKNTLDERQAQYTQYVYDNDGNKIRQFTGLTKPLTISLKSGEGENSYEFVGKTYHIDVSGKAKKDTYSETKYTYNRKNELVEQTNPEGNTESYRYDVCGNLVETVDYKKNITKQTYDYQNRVVKTEAADTDTKKTVEHTWEYDEYGNVSRMDDTAYTYDTLSGQVTKESTDVSKKTVEKTYRYDGSEHTS